MQRQHEAGISLSQTTFVGKQLLQAVTGAMKQQLHHQCRIAHTEHVKRVWDGEDDVVVGAIEQPCALRLQPAVHLHAVALRAGAVTAGVIPDAFDVAVLAALHMAA